MTSEIEQETGDGPRDADGSTPDGPAFEAAPDSSATVPPATQAFGADGATAARQADAGGVTTPAEPPIYVSAGRPRGLNAYFAPGGEDLATDERRADERRNLRLLLLMIAALVLIPTVLTIIAFAQELVVHRGG